MPLTGAIDARSLELFEEQLTAFLRAQGGADPLAQQVVYHFGIGQSSIRRGKRLRPRFVMAAAACYGAKPERTMAACVAVELLHNYSLIHDDIEDADRLRHERPTLWTVVGLEHAINAGDAVGALAHVALAGIADTHGAEAAFAMSMELAQANLSTCIGQGQDLALAAAPTATLDQYLAMTGGKTAALFACAGALGALCASAEDPEVERSREAGRLFGMGFQIRDDILGIWGTTQTTGKPEACDLMRRKKTFPVVWAMQRAGEVAAAIESAYAQDQTLDAAAVQRLRELLKACGAFEAASTAADTYFNEALVCARGDEPLSDFVVQNRM